MNALDFDHLVVMVRDQLAALAPLFQQDGYCLTDVSVHNLGSINRLITLDSTYIELLGWPPGKPPARKEIADSPVGLEALVFRAVDAHQTYEQLKRQGFDVNPVQRLERPLQIQDKTHTARFDTVRFATQPIAGFRVYFCQHLTPELIWFDDAMRHANEADSLDNIVIKSSQPQTTAQMLSALTNRPFSTLQGNSYEIRLANIRLMVQLDPSEPGARIAQASVVHGNGRTSGFDTHLGNP